MLVDLWFDSTLPSGEQCHHDHGAWIEISPPTMNNGWVMRLVTRADLDGLACALIASRHEKFDEIVLVHPQEITDKTVEITSDDILANLPYHPGQKT